MRPLTAEEAKSIIFYCKRCGEYFDIYVLFNQQKHESGIYSVINDYSSVLYIKNGMDLIRKFAKDKALTLRIQKGSSWIPDPGSSYLSRVALFS